MNQKQSEDFDSTIRKLTEEAESAYQVHSWVLMEKLLDDKKNKKRLALWYWPLGALGFITLVWFGYSYFISPKQDKIENQQQINPSADSSLEQTYLYAITITADRIFDLHETPTSVSNKTVDRDMVNNPVSLVNSQKEKDANQITSYLSSVITQKNLNKSKDNKDWLIAVKYKNNSSSQHPSQINSPIMPDLSKSELIKPVIEKDLSLSQVEKTERIFNFPSISSLDLPLDHTRKINLKDWPDVGLSKNPIKHSNAALILNVNWSPEYTAVVKRSIGKLGNTFGLSVGYRLNKWTISAGLQKSSKDYNAKKEDYQIEESSYYKNLTFINIKGDCNLLQLPVTLGYMIVSNKHFILQLNASVSSLRMDKEKYEYDYFHQNWKPGHDILNYSYKNWHWLAAASAGLSIQKSFAKNWNISINPYYQLPLKGIGEGKVRLQSFGSQVGIHWNIPMGK
ncbi:MAG: hypothetical protein ABI761_17915 [Saprospiraceae bacterium]